VAPKIPDRNTSTACPARKIQWRTNTHHNCREVRPKNTYIIPKVTRDPRILKLGFDPDLHESHVIVEWKGRAVSVK
jgi:hypothetical protein